MRKKFKNMVIKEIVSMLFIIFLVSGSALDSDYWMEALAVLIVSFAVLTMFAIASGALRGDWDER